MARADGFTLMEVVVALFLVAVGVIATAPLFVFAAQENAGGGDMGRVGAVAVRQMEQLRLTQYGTLAAGGSLSSSVSGYSDDSDPEVVVRWSIADNSVPANSKTVTVRATSAGDSIGARKQVTLMTVRGR